LRQQAAFLTRELEDEKQVYLNNLDAYIAKVLGRPSILKGMRHLTIFDVAAGAEHVLFLTREGHVYSWGMGRSGKLGHGG
jgi:alpha-tubulin suppressor-like RCC1 family protein